MNQSTQQNLVACSALLTSVERGASDGEAALMVMRENESYWTGGYHVPVP
jgi:hypothetical protein